MSKKWLFVMAAAVALTGCAARVKEIEFTMFDRWNAAPKIATEKATVNTVTTINEVKEVTK